MSSNAAMRVKLDLKKHFLRELERMRDTERNAVLDAALDICQTWSLSAEDLYFTWEAYSLDHGDAALDRESVKALRRLVEQKQAARHAALATPAAPGRSAADTTDGHAKGLAHAGLSTSKKAKLNFSSFFGGATTPRAGAGDPVTPMRPQQRTYGNGGGPASALGPSRLGSGSGSGSGGSGSGGSISSSAARADAFKTPLAPRDHNASAGAGGASAGPAADGDTEMEDSFDLAELLGPGAGASKPAGAAGAPALAARPRAAAGASGSSGAGAPVESVASIKAAADARHAGFAPFEIVDTLNGHLDTRVDPNVKKGKVFLGMSIEPDKWAYRYMFEQKRAYTAALDERIDRMADVIEEFYELGAQPFGDPTVPSQDDIYVVGRVCPALPPASEAAAAMASGAKWAATGVPKLAEDEAGNGGAVLETSKKMGDGERVKIVFEGDCRVRIAPAAPDAQPGDEDDGLLRTDRFGIFPGMLVGLKGRNGTGDAFAVQEVLLPPRLPEGTEEMKQLEKFQLSAKSMNGQPLKLMVAAGPFTSDSDLSFAPLQAIVDHIVEQETPDMLILLGPFLSRHHPLLQAGDVDDFPEDIFRREVSDRIVQLLAKTKHAGMRIALVPSTKDIVSAHAAYPQPMFDNDTKGEAAPGMFDKRTGIPDDKRIYRLPNPCAVWINEVFVGLSTADVLRDVRSEEMVVQVEQLKQANENEVVTPDALLRVCGHILNQRCFYPLYPSSPASNPPLPLDISHAHLADFNTVTPDVLILPSVLSACSKLLDPTICVNPGFAGGKRGDRGGTVAMITVHPQDGLRAAIDAAREAGQSDRDRIGYDVPGRTRVDILKL